MCARASLEISQAYGQLGLLYMGPKSLNFIGFDDLQRACMLCKTL